MQTNTLKLKYLWVIHCKKCLQVWKQMGIETHQWFQYRDPGIRYIVDYFGNYPMQLIFTENSKLLVKASDIDMTILG